MNTTADVTVVIPTFNGRTRGFIGRAVASVRAQTLQPRRLLVVDDGSDDDTVAWLRTEFPGLEVVTQANAGPSSARNHGIRLAGTTYVAFLDDDDEWLPTKLATQMPYLAEHPDVGLLFCGMEFIDQTGTVHGRQQPLDVGWSFPEILLGNSILPPSTIVYAKALIARAGYFDESMRFGEDYEHTIRCAMHGRIAAQPDVLVRYRRHGMQSFQGLAHVDDVTVGIIDGYAARHVPQRRQAIVRYFCYGAAARALLRRDVAYARTMLARSGGRVAVTEFLMRLAGIVLSAAQPLKRRWRRWEYRRVLGGQT